MSKKFLFINTAWFLLVTISYYFLAELNWTGLHPKAQITNTFFFFLTLNIHFIGVLANKKFKEQFALIYMLIITFRLLGSLTFFTIIWYTKTPDMTKYAFHFLFLYFFYTVFEISTLLATLRPNLKR